ncbi:hypothetical protein F4778DRAFT_47254 [Xylariomycetidae sp. FL2044]|nr:hypothetical protein F4778DRAFT_47254 [Xylariomycetidae sp. FL2044]
MDTFLAGGYRLLVVAKVGSIYRRLATAYSCYSSGPYVARTCLRLLVIFSCVLNLEAVRQELAVATKVFEVRDSTDSNADGLDNNHSCLFPFITTCLILGASYDPRRNFYDRIDHEIGYGKEPFGLGSAKNSEKLGIAVVDITDLSNLPYCFVLPASFEFPAHVSHLACNTPLSVKDYLDACCDYRFLSSMGRDVLVRDFQRHELIGFRALADIWPLGNWPLDDATPTASNKALSGNLKSLKSIALDMVVMEALATKDFDISLLDQVRKIPGFQSSFRDCLTSHADKAVSSPSATQLMQIAFAGQKRVDLGQFDRIPVRLIQSVLQSPEIWDTVDIIILPSSAAAIPATALVEALPQRTRNIEELYLIDAPRIEEDGAIRHFCELLPRVNKLIISSIFRSSIRHRLIFPPSDNPPPTNPEFSALQIVLQLRRCHKWYTRVLFLGDALLSPIRLISGLFNILMDQARECGNWTRKFGPTIVAAMFASAPVSLQDDSKIEISLPPAELHSTSKSWEHTWSRLRDLTPESWTVFLVTDEIPEVGYRKTIKFRLAFVKAKRRIQAQPSTRPVLDDIDVLGIDRFLDEVAPGTPGLPALKGWLEEIITSELNIRVGGPLLSDMTTIESLSLLKEALRNNK